MLYLTKEEKRKISLFLKHFEVCCSTKRKEPLVIKHTLLIDGEFGFVQTIALSFHLGRITIRTFIQLTFVCDSNPDSYQNAYEEDIKELEKELQIQLMAANKSYMERHLATGLSPSWLRLTIVERWKEEVG